MCETKEASESRKDNKDMITAVLINQINKNLTETKKKGHDYVKNLNTTDYYKLLLRVGEKALTSYQWEQYGSEDGDTSQRVRISQLSMGTVWINKSDYDT